MLGIFTSSCSMHTMRNQVYFVSRKKAIYVHWKRECPSTFLLLIHLVSAFIVFWDFNFLSFSHHHKGLKLHLNDNYNDCILHKPSLDHRPQVKQEGNLWAMKSRAWVIWGRYYWKRLFLGSLLTNSFFWGAVLYNHWPCSEIKNIFIFEFGQPISQ